MRPVKKKSIDRYMETAPKDPESGIMCGAEPRDLGPVSARHAALFIHGFSGGSNNFNTLPEAVAEKGWRVRVMRLPGHGNSPYAFAETPPEALLDGVLEELKALRDRYASVVLIGHSMGGALAVLAAAQAPINGLILAAPFFAITKKWYYLLRPEHWVALLSPWMHWIHKPADKEPVNRPGVSQEIFSYEWLPTAAMRHAIDVSQRAQQPEVLRKLNMPLLVVHSQKDQVTCPKRSYEIFEATPSTRKRFVELTKSDHIIFWDYEARVVSQEVCQFLDSLPNIAVHHRAAQPPVDLPPEPEIRVKPVDAEAVRPLRHKILRAGKPFESTLWEGDRAAETVHFGVFLDNTLVGVASLLHAAPPEAANDHACQIRGMAVLAEHQGKGFGRRLVKQCLEEARQREAACVWCNARAVARPFYEHCGFEARGESFTIPKIGPHFRMFYPLS